MNNLIRFKLKMLIVLTFCVFMTFSMMLYVMKMTENCDNSEDEMCFRVSKIPVFKATFVYYNAHFSNTSETTTQLLKSSFTMPGNVLKKPTTALDSYNKTKRTTRQILKFLNTYNFSLVVLKNSSHEFKHSVSRIPSLGYSMKHQNVNLPSVTEEKKEINYVHVDYKLPNILKKKSHVEKFRSAIDVYLERRKLMQNRCRKYYNSTQVLKLKKIKFNHILIDERHKILYCYVPKVACTNWKRIFLVLTGKANNISEVINLPAKEIHAKNLFKSLQNYSLPEVQNITEEYTKFIFVRHPFERLLSAFRNKLEQHYDSSKYFQARFGKYIIKKFRKNPTSISLEKGDDVTFAEFVNYVISINPNLYNEHWQRVADLCHPCLVNYDFIGKYESLIEDSTFLLKYFGLNISFPILPKPSTTATNLKKYYNTLDKATIFKLYNIYEMDFRLFGYDLLKTFNWSSV